MSLPALLIHLALAALDPARAAACEVKGVTQAPADLSRSTRACQVARDRFFELMGSPVPEVTVILWEEKGYRTGVQGGRAVIYWPTERTLAREATDGRSPYGADPWGEVLPHEIAHVLLAARFFGSGPAVSAGPGGYGTPFPDWLDEGVAIWVEPAATRQRRLGEARSLPEPRRALHAILSGRHPAAGNAAVMAMRDGAPPPESDDLVAFYPQSIALLGFVLDAGGRSGVVQLAERLRADPQAGVRALLGLPGIPRDVGSLEAAWRTWLDERSGTSRAAG